MKRMNMFDWLVYVLVVVGAINWGLIGAFDFNFVVKVFGSWPMVVQIVYVVVGLAGLYKVYEGVKCFKEEK